MLLHLKKKFKIIEMCQFSLVEIIYAKSKKFSQFYLFFYKTLTECFLHKTVYIKLENKSFKKVDGLISFVFINK